MVNKDYHIGKWLSYARRMLAPLGYSNLMTLREWVTLRINFRLKGYVLHQYLWTMRWGNDYTTILLLGV